MTPAPRVVDLCPSAPDPADVDARRPLAPADSRGRPLGPADSRGRPLGPANPDPPAPSPADSDPPAPSPADSDPPAPYYPISLSLAGRRAIVVGGGEVALRRVTRLLECGARVVVIAPDVLPDLAALPVTVLRRRYRDGDLSAAWFAHAATDDPAVNAEVAAEADRHRIWCVRADDATASAAWTPAVARYGAVAVAVTAGRDPHRAKGLRYAIALALADGTLEPRSTPAPMTAVFDQPRPAADLLSYVSDGRTPAPDGRTPAPSHRQQHRSTLVAETASSTVERCCSPSLNDSSKQGKRRISDGSVALVGGGPGDPGLITVLGRQLLAEADVVVADQLAPRALLAELDPRVEVIDAGKRPNEHNLTQEEINELIVGKAQAGKRVVRLKGGDPFVFGRGGEEALACARAGVAFHVVPGVTSAVAVPACAGIPVTHRGVTQDFAVVSAHLDPSHPGATVDWAALARGPGTLVLLMAVARLDTVAAELVKRGRDAATPVALISNGTTPDQQVLTSTLGLMADDARRAGLRPPAVVVIGEVVRLREQLVPMAGRRADAPGASPRQGSPRQGSPRQATEIA